MDDTEVKRQQQERHTRAMAHHNRKSVEIYAGAMLAGLSMRGRPPDNDEVETIVMRAKHATIILNREWPIDPEDF